MIRAKLAQTPETSKYTSAYDRICSLRNNSQQVPIGLVDSALSVEQAATIPRCSSDDWLALLFIDERAEAYGKPIDTRTLETVAGRHTDTPPSADTAVGAVETVTNTDAGGTPVEILLEEAPSDGIAREGIDRRWLYDHSRMNWLTGSKDRGSVAG